MKKLIALLLVLVTVVGLVACGAKEEAAAPAATEAAEAATEAAAETGTSFPDGPITWVVPWKPGGANDICARLIAPELEKVLGVPVSITNTDGGGGWIGYNTVLAAEADGYTICNVSLPGMISSYVNPEAGRTNTYRDFAPLINFARDYTVICMRPDETRFSTFAELVEYSKTNEIIIAGTAGTGDDAILCGYLGMLEGCNFVMMGTGGSSESLTNLYGAHADVCIANVSEVGSPLKGGQLKVLAISAEERSSQLPDVPTIEEEIGEKIVVDSSRGILTKAGTPEEVLTVLRDALKEVLSGEELKAKLAEQGIDVQLTEWEAYTEMLQDIEDSMYDLGPTVFGWDVEKP